MNLNLVKKVAAAPGGTSQFGPMHITRNARFFACSSRYSILFYSLPDFVLTETLCVSMSEIRMIALSEGDTNLIGILFSDNRVQIYDFVERCTVIQQKVPEPVGYMGFNGTGNVLLLFPVAGEQIYFCSGEGDTVSSVSLKISRVKDFINVEDEDHSSKINIFFACARSFHLIRYTETGTYSCSMPSAGNWHMYCMHKDPLNSSNVLVIGKKPVWKLGTVDVAFPVVSQSVRDDVQCRCGSWVPSMPGYIITGDAQHGIVYYWSLASGDITDRVFVYDYGIVTMMEVSRDNVVLVFEDGAIELFNVIEKKLVKKPNSTHSVINNAHTSTIFSCGFLPTDPSILATAGADHLICLWKVPDLATVDRYKIGHQSPIIDISFSPGGTYIVCGTAGGDLIAYSTQSKSIVFEKKLQSSGIVSVSWCPLDSAIVAVATYNSMCYLYDIERRETKKAISVKSSVNRVRWSTQSKSVAIACANGSLYIRRDGGAFNIVKGPGSPLFDVAWNPFDDNLVAASDDEGHVIVFHLDTSKFEFEQCSFKHGPVAWSPLVPYILFSGGSEGELIMWDTRSMKKMVSIDAHSLSINAIAIHKDRPFTVATVSRDETVRLWSFEKFFPSYPIEAVLSGSFFDIEKYCQYEGSSALAKILHRLKKDGVKVVFRSGDICHINDIVRVATNRVTKLTASVPNDQATLARAPAARRKLIEAADLCLNSGNVKRYCELLFVAGEYEKALAAAPGVSYAFWQNLMMMRSDMLKGSEQSAQLALVAGNTEAAVNKLIALKEFDSAQLIIASLRDHTFTPKSKSYRAKTQEVKPGDYCQEDFAEPADITAYKVASRNARNYLNDGKPLLAAAAFMSIGDILSAQWTLMHSGNIIWAKVISTCSQHPSPIDDAFVEYCVLHGALDLIINKISKRKLRSLIPLINFSDDRERDAFYMKHGIGSVLQYSKDGNTSHGPKKVEALLLAGKPEEAQAAAITLIKPLLTSDHWNYMKVREILALVQNVKEPIPEIVAVSYICGIYTAMWMGYHTIIKRMVDDVTSIAESVDWLQPRLREIQICNALTLAAKSHVIPSDNFCEATAALQAYTAGVDGGSTVKSNGTNIVPVDIDAVTRISYCTNTRIEGNYFILEDGKSAISDDEALMWFEVTPFSPLPTHHRLSPY